MVETLPEALRTALSLKVHQRYVNGDESATGWQGIFKEEEVAVAGGAEEAGKRGGERLVALRPLEAFSEVFLIDHLWCTTHYHAREQLMELPVIHGNMKYLLGIDDEDSECEDDEATTEDGATYGNADHDGGIDKPEVGTSDVSSPRLLLDADAVLAHVGVSAAEAKTLEEVTLDGLGGGVVAETCCYSWSLPDLFPECRALSLQDMGLGATGVTRLIGVLQGLPALKAVWLNGNPLCGDQEAMGALRDAAEKGGWQILNRKFTAAYGIWSLLYLTDSAAPNEIQRLDLRGRGIASLKEEVFAELVALQYLDIRGNAFHNWDVDALPALRRLPRLKSLRVDAHAEERQAMQLVKELSHTLVWLNGRRVLRVGHDDDTVIGLGSSGGRREEVVDGILESMWSIVEPVRVAESSDHHPELYWYVMDTPGLAVCHGAGEANMAMVALREPRLGVTFSAFWPVKSIAPGDIISRDFMEGFPPSVRINEGLFRAIWGRRWGSALDGLGDGSAGGEGEGASPQSTSTKAEHVQSSDDTTTTASTEGGPAVFPPPGTPLPVWTDMPVLQKYLSDARFPFTDDPSEAAVLWTAGIMDRHHPEQYTTSLPGLDVIDDKCLMARSLQAGSTQPWRGLPRTFCLPEDLDDFVASVQEESRDPWIVKPPHLARGWDIVVLSSVAGVLRHMQVSERLSVSAYVANPDTYRGHKYDLRLYCLLFGDHKVLIHDHFRIRLASQPYSLSSMENVHVHLTNTTLDSDGKPAETLSKEEFVAGFAAAHGGQEWEPVRDAVDGLLADVFARLVRTGALGKDPRARVLLGVDVLLDRTLRPWLIEINASPNCLGLCEERPDFFDQVFVACFDETGGPSTSGFRQLL